MADHEVQISLEQKARIEALYRAHHLALIAFLSRMVVEGMEPEDIAQEAYYRLTRLENFAAIDNPKAFLFKTATNLVNDLHRRNFRRSVKETIDITKSDLSSTEPSQEQILQGEQELALMRKALRELNPTVQAVFTLHRFGGRSQKQIAAQLKLSLSMVEKHMNRAVNYLRDRVQQAGVPQLTLVNTGLSDKQALSRTNRGREV